MEPAGGLEIAIGAGALAAILALVLEMTFSWWLKSGRRRFRPYDFRDYE